METTTAPAAKSQPVQPPAFEVTLNADLMIPKFWNVVQAVIADQIAKGKLRAIGMGVYGCSEKQHAELKTALDKAFSDFGTKNL